MMKIDAIDESTARIGRVKWFDQTRDFGFIVPHGGGPDIMLHGSVLRSFGVDNILEHTEVEVEVSETQNGLQARKMISQRRPEPDPLEKDTRFAEFSLEALDDKPLLPARIKWYNHEKGFGFAQLFGDPQDIFVHRSVLERSKLESIVAGEAISIRCDASGHGKFAVQVLAWN